MKKIMFISSAGGHLSELMMLKSLFEDYNYSLITEKTSSTESLKSIYGNKIAYLTYGTRTHLLSYILKVIYNIIKSFILFIKFQPRVIITTGTHTAVPMCIIGKVLGAKIVFIETYANVYTPTASGKFVYKFADKFIIQWEELLNVYPNAIYLGGLF